MTESRAAIILSYQFVKLISREGGDTRVRGVTLTGSEREGAAVGERAGRNLKKVVLELGGSDPLIVLEDAPLEWTIDSAVTGRMVNTGQCCVGTKRIFLPDSGGAECRSQWFAPT
jgi:succinate-semialdehyde dehydrogenase / glutarate-semialdehyde dehydrogenase